MGEGILVEEEKGGGGVRSRAGRERSEGRVVALEVDDFTVGAFGVVKAVFFGLAESGPFRPGLAVRGGVFNPIDTPGGAESKEGC